MLVKRTKKNEKQINNTARQVDIHVVTIDENWKNLIEGQWKMCL